MISMLGHWAPRLTDKMMERSMFALQQSNQADQDRHDNGLYSSARGLQERSGRAPYVAESSFYTQASLHPMMTAAVTAVAGAVLVSLFRRVGSNGQSRMRSARSRTSQDLW